MPRRQLLFGAPLSPSRSRSLAGDATGGAVARVRLDSIDLLRGLVMVLMALDHVRIFFTDFRFDPVDLAHTYPAMFITRWITHFCAPVFLLLAGTGAYFISGRLDRASLSRFLLTRGVWLVLLEVTLINLIWSFDPLYRGGIHLQVIWAIGCSMIVLSALVRLQVAVVGGTGLLLIFGHNAFDGLTPADFGAWAPLWTVLHVPGMLARGIFVSYPLIPWVGVMAVGYALGAVYSLPAVRRRLILVGIGGAALMGFFALRAVNIYGDPSPWTTQSSPALTAMSFMDVTKYPPSLLFLLATLGPALIALAAFEIARGPVAVFLITFGRVPFFFYVLHIALAHFVAGVAALVFGHGTYVLTHFPWTPPPGWGVGLPGVYAIWACLVLALYPACRWFSDVKRRRADWWLAYL
jgi:uncharacterized membrane protein